MNFKQIRAFREVMLTGSVSKAANNLFRTQPAISSQLTGLEKEIGIKLFERRDGRLNPTPEAEYLLNQVSEVLEKIEDIEENLARVRSLERGRINIVSMFGPSVFFMPKFISEFVKNRNHVDISLFSHSAFQVQQLLSTQRYDVGLVDYIPDTSERLSLIDYSELRYKCICAVPLDDPLAEKESITAADLDGKPLAMLAQSHACFRKIKRIFKEQGLTMNRRFETQFFIPQLTFVEQGLACAIVDPLTVESYRINCNNQDKIVFLPFLPEIDFSIYLITPTHRPLTALASTFVSELSQELQSFKNNT
ncbi:LysR substrate-binding domain-containing protein [Amphritea sp. 1_MG-2023]|uniref:LysR family transcriptional regulator n=1 Tax=Amphritea sp. 1_MG-2023 TaxID=3062670 RepID=UPI0026E1B181|nr:LysR substrate-binding domain-containing protein [Amphritea sp. 1_MG-2023]MDO6565385.1 LysR substrate-binding domain-containing protein [Amphritea sp. 1_MG-2023]